jgi:pimeloyl-ACP methyl ester carboxylesterase
MASKKGGNMRKRLVLFLMFIIIGISIPIHSEPYKPKLILWVHGYAADSKCWGPGTNTDANGNKTDEINVDSIEIGSAYDHFLPFMTPYVYTWDTLGYDTTYTKPGDANYPNKTFMETINFQFRCGSIDPDAGGGFDPRCQQIGWGTELKYRIDQVLEEYYGANWMEDTSAQVILIAHSMGGLAIRQMLVESSSEFKKHINLIITENTPHEGTPFMNLAAGDLVL